MSLITSTTLQLLNFSAIALLISPFLLPFLFLFFIFLAFCCFFILPFWVVLVSPCLFFKIASLDMKLKRFLGTVLFGGLPSSSSSSSSSKKPVIKGGEKIDLDESWELLSLNDSDEEEDEKADDGVEEKGRVVTCSCEEDSLQVLAPKSTSKPDHQSFGEVLSFWRSKEKEGK